MRPSQSAGQLIIGSGPSGLGMVRPSGLGKRYGFATEPRRGCRSQSMYSPANLKKLELRHGSGHGIQWEGTIVTKVTDQALQLGVQPGWKIHTIDEHPVSTAEDVWSRLQAAKWEWRSSFVSFVTDTKGIRAEQAMFKVAEMRAEQERLAKLPFAGNTDAKHIAQLKEEFTLQGVIENVEDRAILIPQLKSVLEWAAGRCHRWRDAATAERSKTAGKILNMEFMTMHHLHHWLIKPATMEKACSLVELRTKDKQPPNWFVSHSWSDMLRSFVKSLEGHLATRSLPPNTPFWVGACATRPHSAESTINTDPKALCFYKAMACAEFHILLVLDSRSENVALVGTPFQRVWCGYEATMCLDEQDVVLDVATCNGSKTSVVTMGLTEEEEEMEIREAGTGYKAKAEREKLMDTDVIEQALSIRLELARSSDQTERQRILNSLANRDLSEAVVQKNAAYDKANARLNCLYALTFWRRALVATSNHDSDNMARLQTKLFDALKYDAWRERLTLSLASFGGNDEKLMLLTRNLPPNLRHLKLDLTKMDLTNDSLIAFASNLPRELETLTINLAQNDQINNFGVENIVTKVPPSVVDVKLELADTSVTKELNEKRNSLQGMRQHIIDEQAKGDICMTFNLIPYGDAPTKVMTTVTTKGKV